MSVLSKNKIKIINCFYQNENCDIEILSKNLNFSKQELKKFSKSLIPILELTTKLIITLITIIRVIIFIIPKII